MVDRKSKIMDVAVVSDAYTIASHDLRKAGLILDTGRTNDRLLEIIIMLVNCGEGRRVQLANKAIAKFEAAQVEWA